MRSKISEIRACSRASRPALTAAMRPESGPFAVRALAACLLAIGVPLSTARAVETKQSVWGFDGQIVMQRFNLLSVLVDNPAATIFDGKIELRKIVAGHQVDAVIVEPLYLAPYSSRWVQFYPYVKSDWDMWEVSWGDGPANKFTPPTVRSGSQAAVLLDDPDAIPQSAGSIRRLPDNLFPPHSTATDCLAAVVLDHVPRWDPARQKSFMEWLRRGGRVYLLHTAAGKYPEFTAELQALNTDSEKLRVGSGYAYRVERTRRQLDAPFVERVISAGIEPRSDSAGDLASIAPARPTDPAEGVLGSSADYSFSNFKWETELMLLTNLKRMSAPEHNWVVIHLLALVYLGLVFPGCFAIGRKHGGDYRVTFGFLLATVGFFSLAFLYVGRRGYNEATVLHSLAIARQQQGGAFDVTQWSNAFAVEGGDYVFAHAGAGRIYSSCQDQEMVRGEIRNGPDAHLLADMPPYSSRSFSHRGSVTAPPIEVAVEDWLTIQDQNPPAMTVRSASQAAPLRLDRSLDRALTRLTLRKGSNFPSQTLDLFAICGRRLYRLKESEETPERIALDAEVGPLAGILRTDQFSEFSSLFDRWATWPGSMKPPRDPTTADVFRALFYPLLTRSLDLADQLSLEQFSLPPDRVRLLIYAPLAPEFFANDARFARQHGRVLYSLDLFEPEPR